MSKCGQILVMGVRDGQHDVPHLKEEISVLRDLKTILFCFKLTAKSLINVVGMRLDER